jgi:hypothetical protein
MKKIISQIVKTFTLYFVPKRIIVSYSYPDGIFIKATEINGKKFITIAVTNKAVKDSPNAAVIHHVPASDAYGVRYSITPFKKWWYTSVLNKPLPKQKFKVLIP